MIFPTVEQLEYIVNSVFYIFCIPLLLCGSYGNIRLIAGWLGELVYHGIFCLTNFNFIFVTDQIKEIPHQSKCPSGNPFSVSVIKHCMVK